MKLNRWLVAAATATVLAGSLAVAGCTSDNSSDDAATEQTSVSGDQADETADTTPGVTNFAAHGGGAHGGGAHGGGAHGGVHGGFGHGGFGHGRGGFGHAGWGHGGWGRGGWGHWGGWRRDHRFPWWY
jgi:hypothetical protein